MPRETSSVIVLPIKVAPASSSFRTAQACRAGTGFDRAQSGLPPPVGWPATSNKSFAAKVRPDNGPPGRPSIWTREPGTKALISSSGMRPSELKSAVVCYRFSHAGADLRGSDTRGSACAGAIGDRSHWGIGWRGGIPPRVGASSGDGDLCSHTGRDAASGVVALDEL